MYNPEIETIDATKLGISKKCHTCNKVRKITRIEPEHNVIHPITGDVFSNSAHHLCNPCATQYQMFMDEMAEMKAAYDEIEDINPPIVLDLSDIPAELFYTGPEPPLFCVM